MLAIEIDGYTHQNIETYNKDVQKEKRLDELGVSVLRFEDKMVFNDLHNVLRTIEIFIEEFRLFNK